MTPFCRILADDLTGALDSVSAFVAAGEVHVALGTPKVHLSRAPVEACATGSRALPEHELDGRLSACADWLASGQLRFKKVDSLMRGNTFAELEWLARSRRYPRLVLAPAFPEQGRFVCGGRLKIATDVPLQDPLTLSIYEELQRRGMRPRTGGGSFGSTQIDIPDVKSDADLDVVVAAFAEAPEQVLWCGSAGLAFALARAHGFTQTFAHSAHRRGASRVLIATASRHPVLRAQLVKLGAHELTTGKEASLNIFLEDFSSADIDLPSDKATASLAAGAARIVAAHAERPPDVLVAIGGDSLLALCQAAGATGLLAGAPPQPGWGSARISGGRWNGVHCLSRSGAFGDADDLRLLLTSIAATPNPAAR